MHLPLGCKAIPSKWILDIKESGWYKARLVACGDLQLPGVDFNETYAPVIKFVSIKVLLIIASKLKLSLEHWDIVTAFLYGELDEELYIT